MADMNGQGGGAGQVPVSTVYLPRSEITTLAVGTVLQGRYRIESVLGLGGMGAVYKVRDQRFKADKYCAVKEMIAKFADPQDERTRLAQFDREANLLASLSHPAIPAVYDYFSENHRAYLVLDYVEGRDLEKVLKETSGTLDEQTVGNWAIQLCDVLHYLHTHEQPIIFRDLKPSNVILTPSNHIVLIDFGIAKALLQGHKGTMVGTEGYSPPEQYRGVFDARSDIYSLGAMMHQLLTRVDPRFETPFTFAERPPSTLNPGVSPAMEAVVMRCLEYEPDQRFRDVVELRAALEDALRVAVPGRVAPPAVLNSTQLVWKFATGDEVRSSPLAFGDAVYVGSYDKHLYALDARAGHLLWKFATEGGIVGRPAAWGDLIVVGSEDFNVYAVDAARGEPEWIYRTWQSVRSSPRVVDDVAYVGSDDGFLHAIELPGGRDLWKFRAWRPIRSTVAHADGVLYFGADDERVYAVDAATGQEKWRHPGLGGFTSSPAIGNGVVYVGSMDFCVYALDAQMGWEAWRARTGNFVISSPCVAGDHVYVGSVDRYLYCLDARTGRIVWKYQSGEQITSSPTVAGDVVYVGGVDGAVYALDAGTGRLRWRFQTGGAVPSSPAVLDGVVYIGSMDGSVYALRA